MFHKLSLLTWKNWLLQRRHAMQFQMHFVLPLTFCILLIAIRKVFNPVKHDGIIFPEYFVNRGATVFNSSFPISRIVWSPCNNSAYKNVMNAVTRNYGINHTCVKNSSQLQLLLQNDTHYTLAGIDFGDYSAMTGNISKSTTVILRFPSELRTFKNSSRQAIRTWRTDLLYPELPSPGPRNYMDDTGSDPNYYNEGFLTLQHDISKEIIKYHMQHRNKSTIRFPTVMMSRFPHSSWFDDEGLTVIRESIGTFFYFMFISVIMGTVKDIADEKEQQLKEVMKIMGLPNWLQWTAWFFKTFLLLIIMMTMVVFLFTVPTPKVLFYTNPFLFFLFLIFYAAAITTFCFLISMFFSKARTATIAALVFWYVSFVPFTMLRNKVSDIWTKLFGMLGLNTAVCFGFRLISMFESVGEGLQFSNIFISPNPSDNLTMGHVLAMLGFDALLYFVLAVYLEGFSNAYGTPKVWYYPCTSKGNVTGAVEHDRRVPESDTYQRGPVHAKALIKIRNLTKIYQTQTIAVQNVSLDIFKGQITVLFGHQGAGKTTILLMLAGTTPPTNGTVIINGYNLMTRASKIRNTMSFCPQQALLFPDLTVREHLYFVSKLKGIQGRRETDEEIKKYIKVLHLVDKKNTRTKYLSGDTKRKLCVAIALCGKPKICLLDEPTSGMDPTSRRNVWDLIRSLKEERTILVSTNSTEEADYLGDKIAILSNGKLQCYGSNEFLRQKYGAGYHLVIQKSSNCDTRNLTEFLKSHVPSIKLVHNLAFEVTYLLDQDDTVVFSEMLNELETNSKELGVASYKVAMSTMDEVFAKVNIRDEEIDLERLNSEMNAERKNVLEKAVRLKGCSLKQSQFIALIMKKATLSIRSWIILVTLILLPICSLLLVFLTSESKKLSKQIKLKVSLDAYDRPISIVSTTSPNDRYYLQYLKTMELENRKVINWDVNDLAPKILQEAKTSEIIVRKRYIIGASFSYESNVTTAWFNNQPYHSSPLSLQYVMNTIFREKLSSQNYGITFVLHPLPFSPVTQLEEIKASTLEIACTIGISIAVVSALYVIFCIKERMSNFKHLQFVSGIDIYLYWLSVYLWDFCTFLVASVCIIAMLFALRIHGLSSLSIIGPLFILFTLFGLAMLPTMYLCSFHFQTPASAFSVMALINMLLGPITFIVYRAFSKNVLGPEVVYDILHWISLIVPHYSLTSGIYELSLKNSLVKLCRKINEETLHTTNITEFVRNSTCQMDSNCCDLDEKYLGWNNHGIGKNLCFLLLLTILLIFFLLAHDYNFHHEKLKRRDPPQVDPPDEDVAEEKRKVKEGEINARNHYVVLHNLTKFYEKKLVVNQLCLGIKGQECFGLLGTDGAGKSTTLGMITGNTAISSGDIFIYGCNAKSNMKQIYKHIGYCPQDDAVLEDLTGKETLTLYCLLKGITFNDSKIVIQTLAKELDFEEHLDKLIRHYNAGTRRKLSVTVALIGDSPILLFDEPTEGMDPSSKRKLWNMLIRQRDSGKCIVLTSHSMEECQAVCTRLAIMVNGTLKCLGTPQYLKEKFSLGYTLKIKLEVPQHKSKLDDADAVPVIEFVKRSFPMASLRERHHNLLVFFIISKRMRWSSIFELMQEAKTSLNIEEYTITQSSMEQMFLHFTKLQSND